MKNPGFSAPRPAAAAALGLTILLAASGAVAQERVDAATNARIRAEGMERSQVAEIYTTLTMDIGPRLAGTPAYNRAANWTREWLAGRGMSEARLEAFEFGRGWTVEGFTLELTSPRYAPLTGYPEAWSPPTRGVIQGRPVYVGDKSAAEIAAMAGQLRGAIVLGRQPQTVFTRADRPQPTEAQGEYRTGAPVRAPGEMGVSAVPGAELAALLRDAGAAAILIPTRGEHGTVFVLGNRNIRDDAVPSVAMVAEQYNMLVRMVERGVAPEIRLEVRSRYHSDDLNTYNVLAEIPGTDPALRNEVVLLGAHLDSWSAGVGAADNADGVAVSMEAMRILKAIDARPHRTIRIALWGAEEHGLLGSRNYVERHLTGPENRRANEAVSVYFNDDPGAGPTFGWYMEGNAAAKAIFDVWLEPWRDLGARRNVIEGIPSTDHLSFLRVGIPGFTAIKDYANYDIRTHHTSGDHFERGGLDDLRQAAVLLASFAWHASIRDERIPRAAPQ